MKRKSKAVKALLFLIIFLLVFYFRGENLLAAEKEEDTEFSYVDSWLDSCDLGTVNEGMESLFPGISIDAKTLLQMIIHGRAGEAFSMLAEGIKEALLGELSGLKNIFIYILLLGVISAVFSEFSDLFAGGQIAPAGFFFLYLLFLQRYFFLFRTLQAEPLKILRFLSSYLFPLILRWWARLRERPPRCITISSCW